MALALPDSIQGRMGRLTGYYERRRKGAGTPIDVPLETATIHYGRRACLWAVEVAFSRNVDKRIARSQNG